MPRSRPEDIDSTGHRPGRPASKFLSCMLSFGFHMGLVLGVSLGKFGRQEVLASVSCEVTFASGDWHFADDLLSPTWATSGAPSTV